ncbi:fimbria/pilus outer membrane usher protein [Pseudomonas sp. HD6422]|uniref:fimbria/pilus outer membrane usher protein n=2 Tax=unclassified Pseudomonas TaxID=196821 RepID=UPI0039647FDD
MPLLPERWPSPSRLPIVLLLAMASGSLLPLASRPAFGTSFDAAFMRQSADQKALAGSVALQTLTEDQPLLPGRYSVEVSINQAYLGQRSITVDHDAQGRGLQACIEANLLREVGVREQALPVALEGDNDCLDLSALIEEAQARLDARNLSLELSIPQASLRRDVMDNIDPSRWDQGIDSAFVNYQISSQARSPQGNGRQTSLDLQFHSGLNFGPWRLRSSQALREGEKSHRQWSQSNTYVQRDLPGKFGNLTFGETFSDGSIFRSLPFKGVQLASDMSMLPDVLQNYAPVIRGVAQTRAKLEVLQNGYPLYSTYVAPGPYVIDDLGVSAGSGELEIVLTEADGQVRRFLQPYSTLGNLLRDGVWRYSATLGRYDGIEQIASPLLWQATLARGGAWDTTLYGGVQGSEHYRAASLGAARDLGSWGALSLDVTQADSDLGRQLGEVRGHSYAARFGKAFQTGTNLRFAGYRYSTQGYRDFDEAVRERNAYTGYLGNRRSRLETSLYQRIGQHSSLSLTLSQDDYWHNDLRRQQYQLQFNTYFGNVSYNLFASQALTTNSKHDRLFGLSISLPLDIVRSANASFDMQSDGIRHSQRASLTGSALDNRLSYVTSASRDEGMSGTAVVVSSASVLIQICAA